MALKNDPLSERTLIPTVKVTPTSVVIYNERLGFKSKGWRGTPPTGLEHLPGFIPQEKEAKNLHGNDLSFKAKGRIKKCIKMIFWMSNCVGKSNNKLQIFNNNKISMLTLTLSGAQFTPDSHIKNKMLNQFFTELRKRYKNILYIWRQEFQKNGNVHFHILINKYIAVDFLRSLWNRIQSKEGYLTEYINKHKNLTFNQYLQLYPPKDGYSKEKRYLSFVAGTKSNWTNPNSIDIHSLKNAKNVYAYITKYLTKSEQSEKNLFSDSSESENYLNTLISQREKTAGRTWFASTELSGIKYNTDMIDGSIEREVNSLFKNEDIFRSTHLDVVVFAIPPESLYNLGLFSLFRLFYTGFKNLFNQKSFNF